MNRSDEMRNVDTQFYALPLLCFHLYCAHLGSDSCIHHVKHRALHELPRRALHDMHVSISKLRQFHLIVVDKLPTDVDLRNESLLLRLRNGLPPSSARRKKTKGLPASDPHVDVCMESLLIALMNRL